MNSLSDSLLLHYCFTAGDVEVVFSEEQIKCEHHEDHGKYVAHENCCCGSHKLHASTACSCDGNCSYDYNLPTSVFDDGLIFNPINCKIQKISIDTECYEISDKEDFAKITSFYYNHFLFADSFLKDIVPQFFYPLCKYLFTLFQPDLFSGVTLFKVFHCFRFYC